MTTTSQLENFCRGVTGFLGVFASDQLPAVPSRNGSLIVNYSPSTEGGTHWCAMANLNGSGPAIWFDSYGEQPDSDDIVLSRRTNFADYLRRFSGGPPIWNQWDLQAVEGPNNNTCGEWSSFFIKNGGQLPRVEGGRFAGAWGRFELDQRQLPRTVRQSSLQRLSLEDSKDEKIARRNDVRVRQWAGIVSVRS